MFQKENQKVARGDTWALSVALGVAGIGQLSNSRGELTVCGWVLELYAFTLETGKVFNSRVINHWNKQPKATFASPALKIFK